MLEYQCYYYDVKDDKGSDWLGTKFNCWSCIGKDEGADESWCELGVLTNDYYCWELVKSLKLTVGITNIGDLA